MGEVSLISFLSALLLVEFDRSSQSIMSKISALCYLALLGLTCCSLALAQTTVQDTTDMGSGGNLSDSDPTAAGPATCLKASCSSFTVTSSQLSCKTSFETCSANTSVCISTISYTGISTVGKGTLTLGCATAAQEATCSNTEGKPACKGLVNLECVTCCKGTNCNLVPSSAPVPVAASLSLLTAAFVATFLMH